MKEKTSAQRARSPGGGPARRQKNRPCRRSRLAAAPPCCLLFLLLSYTACLLLTYEVGATVVLSGTTMYTRTSLRGGDAPRPAARSRYHGTHGRLVLVPLVGGRSEYVAPSTCVLQ